jgi:hypothetical protein
LLRAGAEIFFSGKTMRIPAILAAALLLNACIHTEEMQLAPNIVQLNTQAEGALFVGHAGDVTLQRAAKVTLANGYDYFKFQNAQMGSGQQLVGVQSFGSATAVGSPYAVTATGSAFTTPVYARTSKIGVTVVMFHTGEPGAKDAFDARAIIAKLGDPN